MGGAGGEIVKVAGDGIVNDDKRSGLVFLIVSVGFFLTALDFTIINVAFRDLEDDFGPGSKSLLTWTLSGYAIVFAAGLLTAGRMADTFGRKRAFLVGTGTFTMASMLCGVAPAAGWLVAARAVQAIGAALMVPSSTALVLQEYPVQRRSQVMGTISMMGSVAAASGPLFGGLLTTHLGWRWVFFVNAPFCIAAVIAGQRVLHESRDPGATTRPDVIGALLATGSVALLTLGIIQGEEWGWSSPWVVAAFVAAGIAGIAFVFRCRHAANPVLDLSLLRLRFVSAANLAGLFWAMGFYAFFFNNVTWLQRIWGYDGQKSGFAILPGPMTAAVVSLVAGRVVKRVGPLRVAAPACFGLGLTTLVMAATLPEPPAFLRHWLPLAVAFGVCIGFGLVGLSACANAYLPVQRFAMGAALFSTGRQIGAAVGIAIVTAIQAAAPGAGGVRHSWVYIASMYVLGGLVLVAVYRRPTAEQLAASEA